MDPRSRGGGCVDELVGSMPSSIASFTITSAREFSTEPFSFSPSSSPPVDPQRTQLICGTGVGIDAATSAASTRAGNGPVSSSTVAAAGVRQDTARVSSDPVIRPVSATPVTVGLSARSGSGGAVHYRECLKNHAASVGGHVVDGCGEYMPGEEADGLKCSVCGCHRSFHRKEMEGATTTFFGVPPAYYYQQYPSPHLANGGGHRMNGIPPPPPPLLALPPPQSRPNPHAYNPTPVAAAIVAHGGIGNDSSGGGATTTDSSSEEHDAHTPVAAVSGHTGHGQGQASGTLAPPQPMLSRKRFRTKFTAEQKHKMFGFAEAMGWRMHRNNESALERFCAEIGVSRQVFKVWMHNNKHVSSSSPSSRRPQHEQQQHQQEEAPDEKMKTEVREHGT